MKRLTFIVLAAIAVCLTACANNTNQQNKEEIRHMKRTLVAYFSATGTTKRAAARLAEAVGADLHEIVPAQPYTAADLDWDNKQSRTSREMENPDSRPAIADSVAGWADYDTIFVGFPIWWYTAPTIVYTFLDKHGIKGKTVIPFATSGSSTIGKATADLRKAYPEANWLPGRLLNELLDRDLQQWVATLRS